MREDDETPTDPTELEPRSESEPEDGAALNPMKRALTLVRTAMEEREEVERKRRLHFAKRIAEHTGGDDSPAALRGALVALRARNVIDVIPETMTVGEFLRTPGLEMNRIRDLCERVAQCTRCPAHGGTCLSYHDQGRRLEYRGPDYGVEYVPCDRWKEFERWQDLGIFGVWERFRLESLTTLEPRSPSEATAIAELSAYADEFPSKPQSLILQGPSSINKVRLVSALMRDLRVRHSLRAMHFWIFAEFLHQLDPRRRDPEALEQFQSRAPVLHLTVVDGFHEYKPTEAQREEIDRYVAARYSAGKPWVVTTEVPLEELSDRFGPGTIERLTEGARRVVMLEDVSK